MKTLLVLGAILSFSFAQLYDSNNDNLDIEGLVSDDSKLKAFMDCFLDTATCDDVSADFKSKLFNLLKNFQGYFKSPII